MIAADPTCEDIIKPYLRGQDFNRWYAHYRDMWMIALKSSENRDWPWSDAGEHAEEVFRDTYPSIYARLKGEEYEAALRNETRPGAILVGTEVVCILG